METRENRTRVEPRAPQRTNGDGRSADRSLGELLRELSTEGRTLVRQEVELAKTEMSEKVSVYTSNAASLATGGALLLFAGLALSTAIIYGLIVLLDSFMAFEIAVWLAPLLFAVVVGLVGWSMISKAKQTLARESVIPQQTVTTLREDKQWLQSKVR
ncbi:MAG TPA: phage holin family protein [Longimicrobiales bacterium]|nr:phage holin family protein [Longimicrobiales bacterium]